MRSENASTIDAEKQGADRGDEVGASGTTSALTSESLVLDEYDEEGSATAEDDRDVYLTWDAWRWEKTAKLGDVDLRSSALTRTMTRSIEHGSHILWPLMVDGKLLGAVGRRTWKSASRLVSGAALSDLLLTTLRLDEVQYQLATLGQAGRADTSGRSEPSDDDVWVRWLAEAELAVGDLTSPHMYTSPWDETVMEWWSGDRKLTVYLSQDGESQYVKVWGPDIDTEMEDGDLVNHPQDFAELWNWLRAQR